MKFYYLDTSIWLDFIEKRDEPHLPKGKYSKELIEKIIKENNKIVYSDIIKNELLKLGYSKYEIEIIFNSFHRFSIYTTATKKQYNRSKDLSKKRSIPLFDALHALIARDSKSIMVTRDNHFLELQDIIVSKRPEEII